MKKRKRKYWYFTEIVECPVCGASDTYRERRYTRKPKKLSARYKYTQQHCGGYCP